MSGFDRRIYTVAWVCAIHTETVAARAFLDEMHHEVRRNSTSDENEYILGKIGQHNVVIANLPLGRYGTASAARVAANLLYDFPNVRIGLMVGIAGGAPTRCNDVRLGDLVIGIPQNGGSGVVCYSIGNDVQDRDFELTGSFRPPPTILQEAVNGLRASYERSRRGHRLQEKIENAMRTSPEDLQAYRKPDIRTDILYRPNFVHDQNAARVSCAEVCGNEASSLVARTPRNENDHANIPKIHYGLVASSHILMKNALERDEKAERYRILCFEMEAAGLVPHFPCLVIRGICDYSDSHKNKEWQGYAAMVAAAYAKDLLGYITPAEVAAERRIKDVVPEMLGL